MKLKSLAAAALTGVAAGVFAVPAIAADISMWVRSGADAAAQHMVDLWNASHDDKVQVTVIPSNQMVTKLATGSQAGDTPDILSFDVVFMPAFMEAGLLTDITAEMQADANYAKIAQAYKDIATYDGKIYGSGFTPDVSVLIWNKALFRAAGLDPEKAPTSYAEIHEDAKKITALGNDTFGFYFSGACGGCNGFVMMPSMVAAGATLLPAGPGDKAYQGDGVKGVLEEVKAMWNEGLIPESAQADNGTNFLSTFTTGKIGIQGTGGFAISAITANNPEIDFGIGFLPGLKDGQVSSFVGGDVVAIPTKAKQPELALEFIHWVLTDEAQIEGLAKNNILPVRPDLAANKYFTDPRVVTTAKAIGVGFVPYSAHVNDMVNSDSSPWVQMLQTAIFDSDVDGAIAAAQQATEQIVAQ